MLHKATKVRGFRIHATDGEIGHVDDFLLDEAWHVRYLVVDTSNAIGGRSVLIAGSVVTGIDAPNAKIRVNLSREDIKRSPSVSTAEIELIETLPSIVII